MAATAPSIAPPPADEAPARARRPRVTRDRIPATPRAAALRLAEADLSACLARDEADYAAALRLGERAVAVCRMLRDAEFGEDLALMIQDHPVLDEALGQACDIGDEAEGVL
jgi:hypothetical protein